MPKTPQRSKSELEHLRGENKRLKSINRQLQKRNKELERKEHNYQTIVDAALDTTDGDIEYEICDQCGKGEKYLVDLKYVKYSVCNVCGHKEKL